MLVRSSTSTPVSVQLLAAQSWRKMWKSPLGWSNRAPHQMPSATHSLLCGFWPVGAVVELP